MSFAARSMHFQDMVRFRAERGLVQAVTQAARQQRTTSSEYLRHAVRAKLVADGVQLPAIERPTDSGQR